MRRDAGCLRPRRTASASSASLAPADDLEEATVSLVEALLAAPAPALRALKPLLRGAMDGDRDAQLAREREAQTGLLQAMLGGFGA